WVTSVAFSAQGDRLASASVDGTVQVWDAKTGRALHTLRGYMSWVTSVAFLVQGNPLASALWDKIVRLWDAKTGQSLQTLEGYGWTQRFAFSKDGTSLETENGSILLHSSALSSALPRRSSSQSIYIKDSWVTVDSTGALWLPVNYRPNCTAIQDKLVALGHPSGRVLLLGLS
ncbi:WD40 repeat-like protein, partial [Byssothecium circinans]